MTPDDLVKSLSDRSCSLEIEKEPQYDTEYIIQAEPNQAIRYNQTITDGTYKGTISTSCVSFSSTRCVVKYQGSWVNAKTGVSDCVLRTYNVLFTP